MSVTIQAIPFSPGEAAITRPEPCLMAIFGATGDLTRRKLIPALFHLAQGASLPDQCVILGVDREPMDEPTYRALIGESVRQAMHASAFNEDDWRAFARRLHYLPGDLKDLATYRTMASRLEELGQEHSGNRLFYFATPPSLVPSLTKGLGAAGLHQEETGWSRLVVEKPFGRDLASASALNECIGQFFSERQVYRIDHYLGKETIQNILVFRFGNALFEPVWNRNHIDYVEITAAEVLGVGDRAGYYEEAGALRDMVTNHLLQLLALTAMEPPIAFEADAVRDQKIQVWRSIAPLRSEQVAKRTVRGQYGAGEIDGKTVPAYRDEKNVAPDSLTETYAAVEFCIDNWRWAGVPFYLRTGKRLARPLTEIAVHFKRPPQALFAHLSEDRIQPNVIALRIQPNEGINLAFGAKQPGEPLRTATVSMDFCYQSAFPAPLPSAYETLLLDAMRGHATLFTRRDGVEAQWRLITPILEAWAKQPPVFYAAGSDGPRAADELLQRHGHRWRALRDTLGRCDR